MTSSSDTPLYERIGGSDAIEAAIEAFYERVLDDDRINQYFDGIDMERLKRRQKTFFEYGTGGPAHYDIGQIKILHARHDIDQEAYEIFTGHFEDTLEAFDVPEQEQTEVMAAIHSFHDDVITGE
jgi:hemoglobin